MGKKDKLQWEQRFDDSDYTSWEAETLEGKYTVWDGMCLGISYVEHTSEGLMRVRIGLTANIDSLTEAKYLAQEHHNARQK